jgi:hypothetical protein
MAKNVFASPEMLTGIDPEILVRLLRSEPEMLAKWDYALPETVSKYEGLDGDRIAHELREHGIPEEIAEALSMVQTLGGEKGWELLEHRARREVFELPASRPRLRAADAIVMMMLEGGDRARHFLVRSASLFQAKQRIAYAVFPHRFGWVNAGGAVILDDGEMERLRERIADGLVRSGLIAPEQRRAVKIFRYDTDGEIMFIVRYPGQLYRSMGWDLAGGWKNFIFNPARYDTVIFDPVNCALKTNTQTSASKMQAVYRMAFSEAFFGEGGVFVHDRDVVTMGEIGRKPLADIFHAGGVAGLLSVKLVSILFNEPGTPPVETTLKVGHGESLTRSGKAALFDPAAMAESGRIVRRFTLRYVLERGNATGLLAIERGNVVSYPRETATAVLEALLRARSFIRPEGGENGAVDFWARAGLAEGGGECRETWRVRFGGTFDSASRYLRKTGDLAEGYPHPQGGFPLAILSDDDSGIRAVSNEEGDGGEWREPRVLTFEEAEAHTFDLEALGGEICAGCGIEKDFRREGGAVCRLGLCNGKAVYGYFGAAEEALEPIVRTVGGRDDVACVLVPRVDEGLANYALGAKIVVVPLGTSFKLGKDGIKGGCGKRCLEVEKDKRLTQGHFDFRMDTLGQEFGATKFDNMRLRSELGKNILKVVGKADPEYIRMVLCVLAAGSVRTAAESLGIPKSTLSRDLARNAGKNKAHQAMYGLIGRRMKGFGVKSIERFNELWDGHQGGKGSTDSIEDVLKAVLEGLDKMRPDNFERVRDELMREFGTVFGTV